MHESEDLEGRDAGTGGMNRREFLRVGAAVGGGFVVGLLLPDLGFFGPHGGAADAKEPPGTVKLNAFVRIGVDGIVTVIVPKSEMGQGVLTSLAMLVAEELEADWSRVRAEEAPAAPDYRFTFGMQMTAGSDSIRRTWEPLRKAGATARVMLIEAAAKRWNVPASQCRAERGVVVHGPSGRHLEFGALASEAAGQKPAWWDFGKNPTLKPTREFKIVGKRMARLDSPAKVDGSGVFGLDVQLPGMLVACVARCPVFGGKVESFSAKAALAVPGVKQVVPISAGIAVAADSYWAARQGVEALEIKWAEGRHSGLSSGQIARTFATAAGRPAKVVREEGQASKALASSGTRLEALYELPYLAHTTMEPPTAVARIGPGWCEIWAPTQSQTAVQKAAAGFLGIGQDSVDVHTTLLGGGFGRKAEVDFVMEAVETAKAVGHPVKVVWSREDDLQHDFYRPVNTHRLEGALDADGWPVAWMHRVVVPSILARIVPLVGTLGLDPVSSEGASDLPYKFPNLRVELALEDPGVPVGFWRSVAFSCNTYAVECFLDELAAAGRKDPLQVRRRLLASAPRTLAVLEAAAQMAGWDRPAPAGRYRGIAVCEPFGSFVAQVAEISVEGGAVRVHKVWCAVDCGAVVNPAIVEAQVEGGIAYGLSAALSGEITLEAGRVQQSNFHDYPMLQMSQMPQVEVRILPSTAPPGGVGEVAVPPVAPAVANAILAATGKPVRRLPIKL